MSVVTVQQMADRVAGLLEQRLRIKGKTLEEKMARTGRRLPRKVREAGEALAVALNMTHSPKLMHQVDDKTVAIAYDICVRHLTRIDPKAKRRGLLLDMAARVAFALLVVAVLFVAVAYWRHWL
ncbi:MAG: hypothetical protein WCS20_03995 [Alphaproteobacteria bacterium]|jgi:hypothetical protein